MCVSSAEFAIEDLYARRVGSFGLYHFQDRRWNQVFCAGFKHFRARTLFQPVKLRITCHSFWRHFAETSSAKVCCARSSDRWQWDASFQSFSPAKFGIAATLSKVCFPRICQFARSAAARHSGARPVCLFRKTAAGVCRGERAGHRRFGRVARFTAVWRHFIGSDDGL